MTRSLLDRGTLGPDWIAREIAKAERPSFNPSRTWQARMDDYEFSDEGRSPRFPHGWWLIPLLLWAVIMALGLFLGFQAWGNVVEAMERGAAEAMLRRAW